MAKKGQVSIFIIIGIILIVAIGIYIYVTRERVLAPVEAERVRAEVVPAEARPVQEFVQTCLYETAKEAFKRLGERGGYTEHTLRYNPYEPTQGRAVQFAPDSELKVPFWWHMNADNKCVTDCTFASEQPSLDTIERQVDLYIKKKLPECLNEFRQFRQQQLFVAPTGEIDPDTRISTGNVVVLLSYPLEARKADERHALKEFVTELPLNFYEIYMLATNITSIQAEHAFLERKTRSFISVFGRVDSDALPPESGFQVKFGRGVTWIKHNVEQKMREMLASYIPLLKVTYTRNYRYLEPPKGIDRELYDTLYNRDFTVPVLAPNFGHEVKFAYLPWWKPYFNLNCNGQLCQPEGFSNTFNIIFGIQRYNFAYDISYPVLVHITNKEAFGGEGYSFKFFLEANLRNNEPLAKLEPPFFEIPDLKEKTTLLCDPAQRTGGLFTINVRTSAGLPVSDAEVLYRCGEEVCSIGATVNGRIVERLPRCFGGFLTASHADYPNAVKPTDVLDDSVQTADLIMTTPYDVNVSVKKWLLKKQQGTRQVGNRTITYYIQAWDVDTTAVVNQGSREDTIIMLERKGMPFEDPVTVFAEVCGAPFSKAPIPCGTPPDDASKNIRIYPGDYHVTVYSFRYPSPSTKIPPDRRCVSGGLFSRRRCFWVPDKPIIFDTKNPLFYGNVEFDWTVTDEMLQGAKGIEFYYIAFALERLLPSSNRKIEDLEVLGNFPSYTEKYRELLEPRIIE